MSLQDELVKAGLVSKDKASKVKTDARKQTHRAKKAGAVSADSVRQRETQQRLDAELKHKRDRDRALNQEREALKKINEKEARARQIIKSNRLNEVSADIRYNFLLENRFIRSIQVTMQQRKLLAMGRLGIVSNKEDEYDYPLLSRANALKLAQLFPDRLLLLHPEKDEYDEIVDDF